MKFSYKAYICPPLPIRISSSNNPAGPDSNQNLNLTWPDVFPMSPCTSGPCNYFPCLPLLDSFVCLFTIFLFRTVLPTLTLSSNYTWLFQYLVSPISLNQSFQNLHPYISFFEPISPQTAFHATVLILPQQFSSIVSCTACNSITKKYYMAQCSNMSLEQGAQCYYYNL